ncbi:MAG: hypothetical protein ACKO8Q_09385, partial [Bacteroidota bacterium]
MKSVLSLAFIFLCSIYVRSQDATVIYKNTVGSTVTIETDFSIGSGFFVAPNIIASNYHVIEGVSSASCYMSNSEVRYVIDGYV